VGAEGAAHDEEKARGSGREADDVVTQQQQRADVTREQSPAPRVCDGNSIGSLSSALFYPITEDPMISYLNLPQSMDQCRGVVSAASGGGRRCAGLGEGLLQGT
jgi:hypothetical protein